MRIVISALVARPVAKLFDLSQDYSRRLEWDTYLSEARLVGGATQAAVGVESCCKSRSGAVMVSRYISFSPPTHAAVEMVSGPMLFQQFGGTWRFRSTSADVTEVRFIYNFKVRAWALRPILEPLIAALYRRNMARRIEAFKQWAENVDRAFDPPPSLCNGA